METIFNHGSPVTSKPVSRVIYLLCSNATDESLFIKVKLRPTTTTTSPTHTKKRKFFLLIHKMISNYNPYVYSILTIVYWPNTSWGTKKISKYQRIYISQRGVLLEEAKKRKNGARVASASYEIKLQQVTHPHSTISRHRLSSSYVLTPRESR